MWEKGNASLDGTLKVTGTAHVRSNASIDGDLDVRGGGNVITRRKTTFRYSQFSAASPDMIAQILPMIAGDTVVDITAKLATPFKYGNTGTIVTIALGDMADRDGFGIAQRCGSSVTTDSTLFSLQSGQRKGAYFWAAASDLRKNKVYTAAASLEVQLVASTGFNLSNLTQGAIHVYTDYIQNPD